ncbi:MAG: CRISPR-associated endonuclease Cas2 [Candidatus Moranbacteria bacterium]|nr:CRISPR-associated endonuclease Cas2 [Candidatus Moranbacteria bacterium]
MTKTFKSPIKRKILLLLAGGVALGFARNPKSQRRAFRTLKKDWQEINKQYLYRVMNEFKQERLVDYVEQEDGVTKIVLTEKGKLKTLKFEIDAIKIPKPLKWDKKWRVVMFDIPEKRRAERNILREKLKDIGFKEIQKSVFIHPFPCLKEVNFITEYFQLRNLVRHGEMINISNEEEFKLKFKLY